MKRLSLAGHFDPTTTRAASALEVPSKNTGPSYRSRTLMSVVPCMPTYLRFMHERLLTIGALCTSLLNSTNAQWESDITLNTRLCDLAATQINSSAISDGSGGTFHAWSDNRVPGSVDLFAQHLDANGVRLWTTDGIQLSTSGFDGQPALLADGAGGVWIAWLGQFSFNMQLQHLDASGTALLQPGGVQALFATGVLNWSRLAHDGAGGVMMALGVENNVDRAVTVQRVDMNGVPLWPLTGQGFTVGNSFCAERIRMVEGDDASLIFLWTDVEHRMQRIDTSGTWQWGTNGTVIGAAPSCQIFRRLCADGAGGAFVAYATESYSTDSLHLQHVDADGTIQWGSDGLLLIEPGFNINAGHLVADGVGGSFLLAYLSGSTEQRYHLYHLDASGNITSTTVLYSGGIAATGTCALGQVVNGNCPVLWFEQPPGLKRGRLQRVDLSGTTQWPTPLDVWESGGASGIYNEEISSHADGSTTITWDDNRLNPQQTVRAHHIGPTGPSAVEESVQEAITLYPTPSTGMVQVGGLAGSTQWQVLSTDGRVLDQGMISGNSAQLEFEALATGAYWLALENNGVRTVLRAVIMR